MFTKARVVGSVFSAALFLFANSNVGALPVLLAEIAFHHNGGATPCASSEIQFYLGHEYFFGDLHPSYFEDVVWWEDNETGSVTFNSGNTSDFNDFAQRVTDGQNGNIDLSAITTTCGGTGSGGPEIGWFGPQIDLVGNQLDYVELHVDQLEIEPPGGASQFDADIRWQFWGTPIPEPATAILLLPAMMMVIKRRTSR